MSRPKNRFSTLKNSPLGPQKVQKSELKKIKQIEPKAVFFLKYTLTQKKGPSGPPKIKKNYHKMKSKSKVRIEKIYKIKVV